MCLVQFICKYLRHIKLGITERVKIKNNSPEHMGDSGIQIRTMISKI